MMPTPPKPSSARQRAQGTVFVLHSRMRELNRAWRLLYNEKFPMSDDIFSRLQSLEKELKIMDFDKETYAHEMEVQSE